MSGASCCRAATSSGQPAIMAASTTLAARDHLGAWKARLGIGRMNYRVKPGLYSVGQPDENAPVLVSANYKLTFDLLRKNLAGLDCWLLILDTQGVNVWCAAGKGTFGTKELLQRIAAVRLAKVVAHRRLILPQLGASGVNANEIARRSGFTVIYGPVRASDIRPFLANGGQASEKMRTVTFTLRERLVLTPLELVEAAKISLMVFGVLFLLNLCAVRPFGRADFAAYAAAVLVGTVITPALLPFIPGKAFACKGWLTGLIVTALLLRAFGWLAPPYLLLGLGYLLALPAYAAFLAMNFTGSSTYTSPSGVMKEMKTALPLIALALVAGLSLILTKTFSG